MYSFVPSPLHSCSPSVSFSLRLVVPNDVWVSEWQSERGVSHSARSGKTEQIFKGIIHRFSPAKEWNFARMRGRERDKEKADREKRKKRKLRCDSCSKSCHVLFYMQTCISCPPSFAITCDHRALRQKKVVETQHFAFTAIKWFSIVCSSSRNCWMVYGMFAHTRTHTESSQQENPECIINYLLQIPGGKIEEMCANQDERKKWGKYSCNSYILYKCTGINNASFIVRCTMYVSENGFAPVQFFFLFYYGGETLPLPNLCCRVFLILNSLTLSLTLSVTRLFFTSRKICLQHKK